LEERRFADQKIERRFEAIARRIRSRPEVFRWRGKVVESWRSYRGRRLGPYYRLVYRDRGRDSAVYLGKSPQLSERVRGLLDDLQAATARWRQWRRTVEQIRAELRRYKALWARDLAARGLRLKGFEVRGWRHARTLGDLLARLAGSPKRDGT